MRTSRPGIIPPGKAGWVVLAAAVLPVAIKSLKPVSKAIGDGLINLGKKIKEAAEEPHDARRTEKWRESDMKKRNSDPERVEEEDMPAAETASPMGQHEVEAQLAEEIKPTQEGDRGEVPPKKRPNPSKSRVPKANTKSKKAPSPEVKPATRTSRRKPAS